MQLYQYDIHSAAINTLANKQADSDMSRPAFIQLESEYSVREPLPPVTDFSSRMSLIPVWRQCKEI
jgi:hypothetical protein